MIKMGLYRHFKGNYYRALLTATEATTLETIVVYVPLYGAGEVRYRTLDDFTQQLTRGDYTGPRFVYIDE